jgi:chemotaxis protein MotB
MNDDFNMDSDDEGSGNEWLATYGDLVTLLLCFFVLLFAMSNIDARKFKAAIASFQGTGITGLIQGDSSNTGDSILDLFPSSSPSDAAEMQKLYDEVKELIATEGLNTDISLEASQKGVMLVFKDDLLFAPGSAQLKPTVKSTLSSLGEILKQYDRRIRIEGHTDNVPINNSTFPSNWELSTARAISVVKYFTEELNPSERFNAKSFEVAGFSEYAPVAPNDTAENRQRNRRIEIIVLN